MFSPATSTAYDLIKPFVWAAALAFLIGFCGVFIVGGGGTPAPRAQAGVTLPADAPADAVLNPARAT